MLIINKVSNNRNRENLLSNRGSGVEAGTYRGSRNVGRNLDNSFGDGERLPTSKKIENYEKEFNEKIGKQEKVGNPCSFCSCKPARYKGDCGCFLCKEHSKTSRDNKKCIHCEKVIHKLSELKSECGICFQQKKFVTNFKCGCALLVCKECYIKCKMINPHCPACRREINQ